MVLEPCFYALYQAQDVQLNRYNRAELIQSLRWKIGPVLPQEIQVKLNYSDEEYFKNHYVAIESYMSELDLDLTVVILFTFFKSTFTL